MEVCGSGSLPLRKGKRPVLLKPLTENTAIFTQSPDLFALMPSPASPCFSYSRMVPAAQLRGEDDRAFYMQRDMQKSNAISQKYYYLVKATPWLTQLNSRSGILMRQQCLENVDAKGGANDCSAGCSGRQGANLTTKRKNKSVATSVPSTTTRCQF